MSLARRRPLAGLCAIGAIALAAGCGGGGDDSSADDFRSRADAICQASKDAIADLERPTSSSTADDFVEFLTAGLDASDDEIAKLRDLEAPEELREDFGAALDLLDERQDRIRELAQQISVGEDIETAVDRADDEIEALNDRADARAREIGLAVCGSDDDEDSGTATTATATAPSTVSTAPATTPGAGEQVTADLGAARSAFLALGQTLQAAGGGSIEQAQAAVPDARENLADFDAAIAKLDGETASDAALERTRAAVAAAGPGASDALSDLLDAVEDGDQAAVQRALPTIRTSLTELQSAFRR